jgi:hypothetical protein
MQADWKIAIVMHLPVAGLVYAGTTHVVAYPDEGQRAKRPRQYGQECCASQPSLPFAVEEPSKCLHNSIKLCR